MFGPPGSPFVAGIQASVVAVFLLAFGYLIVDALAWRSDLGAVFRLGLAFPAVAGYAFVLMLLHMATGGAVFSSAWLTRGITFAVAAGLLAWKAVRLIRGWGRGDRPAGEWRGVVLILVLTLAGVALWGSRAFRVLPLDLGGDTPSNMGLASQLLNGETTPAASITGQIPNFYPWLYHATIALFARLTPGGRAYDALDVMQIIQPAGAIMALFALGWEIARRWETAVAAAVFGGMAGGFRLRFSSDLARRPYNVVMANLSPPYPGDVTVVLLVAFLALATAGLARGRVRILVWAGVVLGLAGLTGAEAFFVGLLVAATLAVVPAIAIYGIWVVPLVVSYLRLGGFVNITRIGPVNLGPIGILAVWGMATPFAAYGFVRWLPRVTKDIGVRVVMVLLAAAAAILVLSGALPGALGSAFLALGRRHRYWPLLELAVALFAALGVTDLISVARRRRPAFGVVASVAIAALVLGFGLRLPLKTAFGPGGHRGAGVSAALEGDPNNVLNVLAPSTGRDCTAALPNELQIPGFAYTGYRLVLYRWPAYSSNLARIRWRDIYQRVPGDRERVSANRVLVSGNTDPETWAAVARRFGVDVVVVPSNNALSTVFDPYPREPAAGPRRDYVVVRLHPCG